MARDDEPDWIPCQRLSNGPGCGGSAQGCGKLAVSPGLSRRDLSSGLVHQPRERVRSIQVKRDVEKILHVALEVLAYSLDDRGNLGRRRARLARAGVARDSRFGHFPRRFRKLKQGHGRGRAGTHRLTPRNSARAQWRLEEAVRDALHWEAPSEFALDFDRYLTLVYTSSTDLYSLPSEPLA